MIALIFELILIAIIVFLVDLLTYKYIRILDKKERAKLAKRETEYLQNLIKEMNKE